VTLEAVTASADGLTGFEPATSWSRTNGQSVQLPDNAGETPIGGFGCTAGCTSQPTPTPSPPTDILLLLAQLAALPADQRAALAALLTLSPAATVSPIVPPNLDDSLPPGFAQREEESV
jgi:hypothetical protein